MGLGVNIHFQKGNKNDLFMLKESGIGMVRMDVSWNEIERGKGIYDFSRLDMLVLDMKELGIQILFIIDYGNKLYNNGLAPNTDESLAAKSN